MSATFLTAIQARRTHYGLSKASSIPDDVLKSIIRTAITHVPSAFNVQSARVVLLLGKESDDLWEIVRTGFLKTVAGDKAALQLYDKKITEHKEGYGTILFFEDYAPIDAIASKQPGLANFLPVWSENSTGMLQFVIWTALATEGLGASLQHHGAMTEEIAQNIRKRWNLPSTWKSTAMMPFGIPTGAPGNASRPKTFQPLEERFKVFA